MNIRTVDVNAGSPVGVVGGALLDHDQRALALVVDARDARDRVDVARGGDRPVELQGLLTEHHAFEGEVAGPEARVGPRVGERADDRERERRVHELGRARVALGRERDVVETRSDRDGVQRAVARRPREALGLGLEADAVQVHRHRGERSSP